jgi:hypothetical protein
MLTIALAACSAQERMQENCRTHLVMRVCGQPAQWIARSVKCLTVNVKNASTHAPEHVHMDLCRTKIAPIASKLARWTALLENSRMLIALNVSILNAR